jgi:hypothetical protein
MPLTFGLPVNYPSPLIPLPSPMQGEPKEGRMQIPVEILWGSMGGASRIVGIDARETSSNPIEQIASLIVDNSECTVNVTVIFPDTSEKIVIPANAKRVALGVYTNGLQVIVSAPTAIGTDITRMQLLNYRIPPIYVP